MKAFFERVRRPPRGAGGGDATARKLCVLFPILRFSSSSGPAPETLVDNTDVRFDQTRRICTASSTTSARLRPQCSAAMK
jgi:hypothetical protein